MIALWIALGLVAVLFAIALPLLFVWFAFLDVGADDIADVQRFIELTEEARGLVPRGLPLVDSRNAAATTAAIVRFQAKKEEARRALWASRDRRRASAMAEHTTPQPNDQEVRHGHVTGDGHHDRIRGALVEQG